MASKSEPQVATPPALMGGAASTPKQSRGRPKFVPTQQQKDVTSALVACGITQEMIADQIGVPLRTLKRHFKPELASGNERVKAKVSLSIVSRALAGDNKCAIFLMTHRFGWTARHEVSGPGGGPIDLRNLSPAELNQALAAVTEGGDAAAD